MVKRLRRAAATGSEAVAFDGGRWDALPWQDLQPSDLGSFGDAVLLSLEEVDGSAFSSEPPAGQTDGGQPQKLQRKRRKEDCEMQSPPTELPDEGFSEWCGIRLRASLAASLGRLGFSSPTPVQTRAVPLISRGRADVVCAAETGSGKTLAFALPVLDALLADWPRARADSCPFALVLSPTRELALQTAAVFKDLAKGLAVAVRVAAVVGGMSVLKQRRLLGARGDFAQVVVATPGRLCELCRDEEVPSLADLSRVRFLVVDEADRMVEEGHFPELSRVFGVIRDHEQIAASGRDPVEVVRERKAGVDEPDSDEPNDDPSDDLEDDDSKDDGESFPGGKNAPPRQVSARQTLLFSATLRCSGEELRDAAKRVRGVGGVARTLPLSIQQLLGAVAIRGHIEVVDVGRAAAEEAGPARVREGALPVQLPATLTQLEVRVPAEDKDAALYYYLSRCSGRTLLFVNAIKSARRVDGLLRALEVNSRVIHAQMQQRQRLRALDAFKAAPIGAQTIDCAVLLNRLSAGVLVATDVAARGLDLPRVSHVIHYDIARSPQTYVHRSGRTARAGNPGSAISLVSPEDR